MVPVFRLFVAVGSLAGGAFGGNASYRVTENSAACHEVHLGGLTTPRDPDNPRQEVGGGACRPEIRSAGETELYLTAACDLTKQFTQRWVPSRDKYAIDLSRPNRVRRIDEQSWQSATPLWWADWTVCQVF